MSIDSALALIARVRDVVDDTATRDEGLRYAAARAGAKGEEIAGSYPEPSGKPLALFYERTDRNGKAYLSKFKNEKQQHFVMGLVAKGKVPRKRTGLLGRSITNEVYIIQDGVAIRVGTKLAYAPFVLDKDKQSHYHMGTWTPLQEKLTAGKAEIVGTFESALTNWLKGYLSRK